MVNPHAEAAIRELRSIDADLLDTKDMEEWNPESKYYQHPGPTFAAFSKRLSYLIDKVERILKRDERDRQDARRWRLMFCTPGFAVEKAGDIYKLVEYYPKGVRLLSTGATPQETVDKYLGYQ